MRAIATIAVGLIACSTCLPVRAATPTVAKMGAVASFELDAPLDFPEFRITYLGDIQLPEGVHCMFKAFRIEADAEKFIVSAGNCGELAPSRFRLGRQEYLLFLQDWAGKRRLAEDQLVLEPAPSD